MRGCREKTLYLLALHEKLTPTLPYGREFQVRTYFSDREQGMAPPTLTELTPNIWKGIVAEIRTRVDDGSFGARYPLICPDGNEYCGTNEQSFWDAMVAEIPDLTEGQLVLLEDDPPSLLVVMDMIEFCWNSVGKPERLDFHKFQRHHHLRFDEEAGKNEFRENINLMFQRNQIAYELTAEGKIERLLQPEVSEIVHARYRTSDSELNRMLETACIKFVSPDERMRREALESLWDAWERIKTIRGKDKKSGISDLLDEVAGSISPRFREILKSEARVLTDIGNTCQIRHSEKNQERLSSSEHVDYLGYRMFAIIHLLVRQIGVVEAQQPEESISPEDDIPF